MDITSMNPALLLGIILFLIAVLLIYFGLETILLKPKREKVEEEEGEAEIKPVGMVVYHVVKEAPDGSGLVRTGEVYQGFSVYAKTNLVLLIDGTGFWLEKPQRLRRHSVEMKRGEREFTVGFDESEIFASLAERKAGDVFTWRTTKWKLLSVGLCEVEVYGQHNHFRTVSLVPHEVVNYWLAEEFGEDDTSEMEPKEALLVEEISKTWGGHQGVLNLFAWTGLELSPDELEEAREVIESTDPEKDFTSVPVYMALDT